jgi:hypothetical protein
MTIEQKFNRLDRVTVHPEALEGLEHLFPEGFQTTTGTVVGVRLDYHYDRYPNKVFTHYVYSVRMDQDRNVTNLQFMDVDLTMLRPAEIVALDQIIINLEYNLKELTKFRDNQIASLEKS